MKTIPFSEWPNCLINSCPNKACIVLESPYCFVHTEGNEHIKRLKIDAHRRDMIGTYIIDNEE
jgi:hypothetical protein